MTQRKFNWRPSLPDHRDLRYQHVELNVFSGAQKATPALVSVRPHCGPVYDQLNLGSCTGNAGAGMLGFLEIAELRLGLPPGSQAPQEYVAGKFRDPSRMFLYQMELIAQDAFGQDIGASMRDICDVAVNVGAAQEATWNYNLDNFPIKPPQKAMDEAALHKAQVYYAIYELDEMKRCLANGYPWLAGISVYESMMTDAVSQTGFVPIPSIYERQLGGHAILIVGYDDSQQVFEFRNSWGAGWGDGGYGWIPYEYMINADLASDFFTIRREVGPILPHTVKWFA